jgi:acyl-CoA synthetase (NDP forming)
MKRSDDLQTLLRPHSVAVVGASDNPDKVGGRPLKYLITQGFRGQIYAVNPRSPTVQGLATHASLEALPEVPDVAILCVGGDQAEAQLEACVRLGVRNAVLFASGFAETGDAGRQRQQRLVDICRSGGVRLVGPNCIGISNFSTGAVLSFASIYNDFEPKDGPIAIVSQSGGIGVCAYGLLRADGWGVRYVATSGNESDVDCADLVEALARDEGVGIIMLYLENVPDLDRMRRALEEAALRRIPVLALRAGRSADGVRSAAWHTGSGGAVSPSIDKVFEECGCRTVDNLDELIATVPLYLGPNRLAPDGSRARPSVMLMSNSGAACVMAADEAARRQVPLAQLSPSTLSQLEAVLPEFSRNRNPIDLTAALLSDSSLLGNTVRCVLSDPGVDAATLGLLAIGGPSYDTPRFARDTAEAVRASRKPVAVYSPHVHVRSLFGQCGLPVFANESDALNSLDAYWAHRQRLNALPLPIEESKQEINHD